MSEFPSLFSSQLLLPLGGGGGEYYRLQGRRHRFRKSDRQTLNLLSELFWNCHKGTNPGWAVSWREQIRTIQKLNSRNILNLVIEHAEHPIYRILAIWLRGRCAGYVGTGIVARFANHPNDRTRIEVARALKRMSAWSQLREMAETDKCERVRRLATTKPANSHRERLARYARNFSRGAVSEVPHPLFVSPELEIDQGRPPKSLAFIRSILERIHRLVSMQPQ